MASPTPNKNMTYPAHGGAVNAWDTPLNADFDQLDLNLGGAYPITIGSTIVGVTYGSTGTTASSTASTLTFPSSLSQNLYYPLSGTLTQSLDLVFPAAGQLCSINNQSSGTFAVTAYPAGSSAAAVTIAQGGASCLFINSGIAQLVDSNFRSLSLQANNTLLGNVFGSSAAPIPLTIGTGLTPGSSISATISAPGFAPPSSFKNLVIKVASATTITVTADYVTTTDGTHYQSTPVNSTVNMGTAGVVDALIGNASGSDPANGTITQAKTYFIWVIVKADGTTKVVAATESTADANFLLNLAAIAGPYTYYGRIGAVRTAAAIAQLMGTWQLGRDVQYVVGLAQTSTVQIARSGATGDPTVPTWTAVSLASLVPTTASKVRLVVVNEGSGGVIVAPNSSYGNNSSTTNPPPVTIQGATGAMVSVEFLLESASIYYASASGPSAVGVLGYTDNI